MKKQFKFLFVAFLLLTAGVIAHTVQADTTISTNSSGVSNWTDWGSIKWGIDSNGTLWIKPQSGSTGSIGDASGDISNSSSNSSSDSNSDGVIKKNTVPWFSKAADIKSVRLEGTITGSNMNYLFAGLSNCSDIDLTNLKVDSAYSLYAMFADDTNLEKITGLEKFNTSKVTYMSWMFANCPKLTNLDVSNWDTSNVTYMDGMFHDCSNLTNLDLSKWNTSNVTSMGVMFHGCSKLNNLDVSKWDTSKVTDIGGIFSYCSKLDNLDVSKWNTSKVTNMNGAFYNCSSLARVGDLSKWDTSNVTNMSAMFAKCSNLDNLDVSNWNTSKVTSMDWMFQDCSSLSNLDVSKWNTGNVTNMSGMFRSCSKLANLDVSKWNTSKVTDMSWMFQDCSNFTNLNVSNWDTSKVTSMAGMFHDCSKLANLDVSKWNTSQVTDMHELFNACPNLVSVGDLSSWDTSKVTNMAGMFYCSNLVSVGNLSKWDISKATDISGMFYGCSSLTNLDVSNWNTSNATNMGGMFANCSSLSNLDVSNWNTSKVTNMSWLFYGCSSLSNLDVSKWDTGKVTNSDNMFYGITKLSSLTFGSKFNINSTNTGLADNFDQRDPSFYPKWVRTSDDMFKSSNDLMTMDASARVGTWEARKTHVYAVYNNGTLTFIQTTDTPTLNTDNVSVKSTSGNTYTGRIYEADGSWSSLNSQIKTVNLTTKVTPLSTNGWFAGCTNLTNVNNAQLFDMSNNTDMSDMFAHCGSLTKITGIENWDVSHVKSFYEFLFDCSSIGNMDLGKWDVSSATNMFRMFSMSGTSNYTLTSLGDLSNWDVSHVTNFEGFVEYNRSLVNLDVSKWNTGNATSMGWMFTDCSSLVNLDVSNWDTSQVTNMNWMFFNCSSLTNLDVSKWDTSQVTNMNNMFNGCSSLTNLDVSKWDTSNVTDMSDMFAHCGSLTKIAGIENWNVSHVKSFDEFLFDCSSIGNMDLSKWDVSSATNMFRMFSMYGSALNYTLTSLGDLSNWDVSHVTDFGGFVEGDASLANLDVSKWDTSKATDMIAMFSNCSSLVNLDVSKWDTSQVTTMNWMFFNCSSLTNLDVSSWDTSKVTISDNMFTGTTKLQSLTLGSKFNINSTNTGLSDNFDQRDPSLYPNWIRTSDDMIKSSNDLMTMDASARVGTWEAKKTHVYAVYNNGTLTFIQTTDTPTLNTDNISVKSTNGNTYTGRIYEADGSWSSLNSQIKTVNLTTKVTPLSTNSWFNGCTNLTSVNNAQLFDMSNNTDMGAMFQNCQNLANLDVSKWNTSKVTDMSWMFNGCSSLTNLDVSNWNTSKVTDMSGMFHLCHNLSNLDVSKWDTSQVTGMGWMFEICSSLSNLDVSNWDTSKVTNMRELFTGSSNLSNSDVSKWDTSKVTNMDSTFAYCSKLTNLDVSKWNTSNVTNMHGMFQNCSSLTNLDVSNWDTSKVTNMDRMFTGCQNLSNLDVSNWDTGKVTDMGGMFANCFSLTNLDVSKWDTSKATDMGWIFGSCSNLTNLDVSKWDTSNAISLGYIFGGCSRLTNLDVSNWDTSKVTTSDNMFSGTTKLQSLTLGSKFNINSTNTGLSDNFDQRDPSLYPKWVRTSDDMTKSSNDLMTMDANARVGTWEAKKSNVYAVYNNGTLTFIQTTDTPTLNTDNTSVKSTNGNTYTGRIYEADGSWSSLNSQINTVDLTTKVTPLTTNSWFNGCTNLTSVNNAQLFDMSNNTNMVWMFKNCQNLTSLDVSKWDTSKVTNIGEMFQNCSSLTNLDVSKWDTSKVTEMGNMFANCSNLTNLDVSKWDTSKVTGMHGMFANCSSLTNLDVSNWDTSNVAGMDWSMAWMFFNCSSLTHLDVSKWNTDKVTDMKMMFDGCSSLADLDVSKWDTSKVTDSDNMFFGCSSLSNLDVSKWDTSNVTDMGGMFAGCSNLASVGDLSNWNTGNVTNMGGMVDGRIGGMFFGCSSLSNLDVSKWNTSKVTNMRGTFAHCSKLTNLDVSNWDTSKVTIMTGMFYGCSSFTNLDVSNWDTGNVTNMNWMFQNCSSLTNLDVSKWDTGNVTNMSWMFQNCQNLSNLDVSKWDTSNVTDISGMFATCSNLTNLNVSNWDTSKVTTSDNMFSGTTKLQSLTLGSKFNINSTNTGLTDDFNQRDPSFYPKWVRTSDDMIKSSNDLMTMNASARVGTWEARKSHVYAVYNNGTLTFIQTTDTPTLNTDNISVKSTNGNTYTGRIYEADGSWRSLNSQITTVNLTTKVTPLSTNSWFNGCTNLTSVNNAQLFDMSNNTDMGWMFNGCSSLANLDVSKWDTSNVTDMTDMFAHCGSLTKITGIENWDVSHVKSFYEFLFDCSSIGNMDLSKWDVSSATNMFRMFSMYDTSNYTLTNLGDLSNWDVSHVTDFCGFVEKDASLVNLNVSKWDTSKATNMISMFNGCSSLVNLDVSKWDTSNVTNMRLMFYNCSSLTNLDVSNWDTSQVTDTDWMFGGCSNLTNLDVSKWDTSNVTNMSDMFYGCSSLTNLNVSNWNTSKVTDMSDMFAHCGSLTKITGIENWDVSHVKSFYEFLFDCSSIGNMDLGKWDVSSATNMFRMFSMSGTSNYTLTSLGDLSNWNVSHVTNFEGFVEYNRSLVNLDVSKWNTGNATSMGWMFTDCSSLTNLDVSNWNTSQVTNMYWMFWNCQNLSNLDVSKWDTSKVTNSDNMFYGTTKLQSLTLGSKFNINSTNTGLTDNFNQRDPSLYSKWVRTSDDMVKSSNDLMTMDASARVGTWTAKKMTATIDITDSNKNTVLESGTLDNYKTIVDKWAHSGYTVGTSNVPPALDPYAPSYKMTYTVYMNPNVSTYSVSTTTPKGTYMFKDGKQVGTKTVNLTIIMNGGAYFTSNKMSDVINQVMSQTPAGWNVESTKYTITDGYGNNQTTPQGGYTVVYSVEFAVDQDKVTKNYGEFDPVLPTDHDSYDAISGGSIKITLPDVYTVTSLATRTSPYNSTGSAQDTVYAFYKLTGVRTGNYSALGNLTFTDGKTGGYVLLDGESAGNYVTAHMPIDWSNANNAGSYKWYESHMSFEYVNNYDNPDMAVVDTDNHMFDLTWYKHNPILFDDTNPSEQQVPYCQLNILGNDGKSFDTIALHNTYSFLQNSGDYLTAKAGYGIEYPYQVMQQFYDESGNATNKEPSGYATTSNLYDNTLTSDINHEELRFYTSSKQLDDVPTNTSNEFAQLNAQYGSVFYPMQFQTLTNIEARSKLLRNGFQTYADGNYDNKSSFNSPSNTVSSMMLGNNRYDPDNRHCDYIKDNVKEGIYPLNINANIGEVTVNKNFNIQIYGSRMASKGSSDGSDGEISIDGTLSGTTSNTTDNLKNQHGITDEEAEQLKDFLKN